MDRLACVNVPELPLQLLIRDNPTWRNVPVVVVDDDSPRGVTLWANHSARRSGIHVGMRYAVALSLCTELRAGVIAERRVTESVEALHTLLRTFSPTVETSATEPGIFWLDASGLHHLYDSLETWGQAVLRAVTGPISAEPTLPASGKTKREVTTVNQALDAAVVVGFDRLCVCAVAKSRGLGCRTQPLVVFDDPAHESAMAHKISLRDMALNPATCDTLEKLGVISLSDFMQLPAAGVRERFGLEAFRLHQSAARVHPSRVTATPHREAATQTVVFDDPESDLTRLTFAVKTALHPLLGTLARRGEALATLSLHLKLGRHHGAVTCKVCPATPTLDVVQLVELTHLKLEASRLSAGVTDAVLTAESVAATNEQLGLFESAGRDLEAAGRALARLRAELGEDAVVRAVQKSAHLPEAQFSWEPTLAVELPVVAPQSRQRPLVRRFFPRVETLSGPPRALRNDGWQPLGTSAGAVTGMHGPFVVSGGWWRREVQRHYYFLELQNQEILWVYFDLGRRQWFAQGRVE